MAGESRTLWETWKDRAKGSVESRIANPINAKVGSKATEFTIEDIDLADKMLRCEAISEVKREIGGESFLFTDYDLFERDLQGGADRYRLRFNPLADPDPDTKQTHAVLLLKRFDDMEYNEEFHKAILLGQQWSEDEDDWVDDPSFDGGFCVDDESDGEVDSTFWRVNDVEGAHEADVAVIADTDGDGRAEVEEVKKSQRIYWDFWRETKDEDGVATITEFIFVDMDADTGYFSLWRGREIDPGKVRTFGN